jgi:hypothetical protein
MKRGLDPVYGPEHASWAEQYIRGAGRQEGFRKCEKPATVRAGSVREEAVRSRQETTV